MAAALVDRAAVFCRLVLGIWTLRQELTDPSIEPAILREAGQQYFTHFYLSMMLALVLHCFAIYLRWRAGTSRPAT